MEVCFHNQISSTPFPEPFCEECIYCLPRSSCVWGSCIPLKITEINKNYNSYLDNASKLIDAKTEIHQNFGASCESFFVALSGQKIIKNSGYARFVSAAWTCNLRKLAVVTSDGSVLIVDSDGNWNEEIQSTLRQWIPPLLGNNVLFLNPTILQKTIRVIGEAIYDVRRVLSGAEDSESATQSSLMQKNQADHNEEPLKRLAAISKKMFQIVEKNKANHRQELENLKKKHAKELQRMKEVYNQLQDAEEPELEGLFSEKEKLEGISLHQFENMKSSLTENQRPDSRDVPSTSTSSNWRDAITPIPHQIEVMVKHRRALQIRRLLPSMDVCIEGSSEDDGNMGTASECHVPEESQ